MSSTSTRRRSPWWARADALRTLRRFGYDPDEPVDGVLTSLQPEGPVLGHNVALFAESPEDLRHQRPDVHASLL